MFEQLLKFKSKLIGGSTLVKLSSTLLNLFSFYVSFLIQESVKLSTWNLFVWKSANFADSYWFLYNDKNSLNETLTLK
jgi:hypothetical protein